ncbi:hypothetical protein B0O99DRAFT_251703 [Bisporella sp. PMI_857]|nr:hypothetical protein B0O99DRAFT_251703 [Bisporella sp. PMI_857]
MDIKSENPTSSSHEEAAAPPSYTDTITSPPSSSQQSTDKSPTTSQVYSSQIQDQLTSLTSQISSIQNQKSIITYAADQKVLSILTAHIQRYLTDFANSGLRIGSLTLVTATACPDPNVLPANHDMVAPGTFYRVVRVRGKEVEAEDGQEGLWWEDEEMARRLAGYLRPASRVKRAEPVRQQVQKAVETTVEKTPSSGGGFFGWGRKKSSTVTPPVTERGDVSAPPPPPPPKEDSVQMKIGVEEVTFSVEDEYGLYEAYNGWGIVVNLVVSMAGR